MHLLTIFFLSLPLIYAHFWSILVKALWVCCCSFREKKTKMQNKRKTRPKKRSPLIIAHLQFNPVSNINSESVLYKRGEFVTVSFFNQKSLNVAWLGRCLLWVLSRIPSKHSSQTLAHSSTYDTKKTYTHTYVHAQTHHHTLNHARTHTRNGD